jgi:SAM-dependent methyltransferase
MNREEPATWHHGLVARWWAEFNVGGVEIDYFRRFVERYGEPVLDVACGAGRLLVPWRRDGVDVDGCDVSADMLAWCREKLAREGLSARLEAQAAHDLAMGRRYRTIVVCGAFGLGGGRAEDEAALRRLREHLAPGGALVFDHELPYADRRRWSYWLAENSAELPEPRQPPGAGRPASDGSELALRGRLLRLDPLEQSYVMELCAVQRRDGVLVGEEYHELRGMMYFAHEVRRMLDAAGFADVATHAAYTEEPATAEHGNLVFVARP